jgi:Rieske Fe-S protein
MKVIDPGHVYMLQNVDGTGTQTIRFVRRRDDEAVMVPQNERREGILTQELLRVAIDRTLYLNAEAPCLENVEIITALRVALAAYESRAARRTVEKHPMIERADVCEICQHMLCTHRGDGKGVKDIDMRSTR